MRFALVRKDLREHGAVIAIAVAFAAAGLAGLLVQSPRWGGRFTGFVQFALVFGPMLVLIVSNRLFVREYSGRTQLFLETLPITRARVFATKWLLGGALVVLATLVAWYAALWWLRRHEVLALREASIPLVAILVLMLTLWSFAAMSAMLGRYRYLAWVLVVFLFLVATNYAGIATGDLPLLRLTGQGVAMALAWPATAAFAQALVIVVVCAAAASILALYGSGAIAATLAQQMTARERAFIFVGLLIAIGISMSVQPKVKPPPFELQNVQPIMGKHTRASVLPTLDIAPSDADALARVVIDDVDSLIDAVALKVQPFVYIQPQQGLDPMVMRRAWLDGAQGIVLKVAPDAPRDLLRELVLHSVLTDATLGRAEKESRHILLDGLSSYWVLRNDPAAQARWWLRAASLEAPVTADTLQQWSRTSEHVSECVSQALAFAAMDSLVRDLGRERLLDLMRHAFAEPHDDVRVLLQTSANAWLARTGVTWQQWAARTNTAITEARIRAAADLSKRPRIDATVTQRRTSDRGITIEAQVTGVSAYWVLHDELGPWTADVIEPARFDAREPHVVLPLSPSSGTRLFTAIETDDPVLGCPVRVLAQRLDIR